MSRKFKPGDPVAYRVQKHSAHPGPRAKDVYPARYGEDYSYHVVKFWTVVAVVEGRVVARTRRGKEHVLDVDDPALRRATWWERLLYRGRFGRADATSGHATRLPT